jgi:arylsulfatase A-like enzyme
MMGSHHMVEKSVMYEEAVRIPWLMRIPQIGGPAGPIRRRVSHIDMVPTLLELMGAEVEEPLAGKSLIELIKGRDTEARDVFMQWNPNSGAIRIKRGGTELAPKERLKVVENEHSRTVITPDGWKLCLSDVDKSQLFNLTEDPGETRNLFDSGRHEAVIDRLTQKIRRWQRRVGDTVKV